jgi:SAM-dependent methyltransferase
MSLFRRVFHRRAKAQTPFEAWKPQQPAPLLLSEQRTYLADAPYLLPKDALEDQRLNFQHHVLYRTISNHYLAPITAETTATILDVGTGTGIWPIEMATLFPQNHILGVDVALSSLPHPLPTNCLFCQANILQGLPFPNQQFDLTHQRLLVAAIPTTNWPGVVRELVRVTRFGGWVELLEIGDTIQNAGPATKHLLTRMTGISKELGFEMEILHHLGDLLKQAGCQTVESQDIPVPLGEWAGTTGQMMKTDVLHGYNALKDSYCPRSRTAPEVFDAMVQAAADEWEQNHASYVFHASYGRRPPL